MSAAAAAAAVVHVVVVRVVVAVPACCRPSTLNTRHKYTPGARHWPFRFTYYELTPRHGNSTRTAICICAAAAVVVVLHTITNFFP